MLSLGLIHSLKSSTSQTEDEADSNRFLLILRNSHLSCRGTMEKLTFSERGKEEESMEVTE